MENNYFTIFTPTYNRATELRKVFDCLQRQTIKNFEWLIVDDGSTDSTEAFIAEVSNQSTYEIRYLRKKNGGKHTAYNLAIDVARGWGFTVLDSDDECVATAIERFLAIWHCIPQNTRDQYSGVSCLCADEHGEILGTPYPRDSLDCTSNELYSKYKIKGDKWGFHRTSVLRQYPYPVIIGENFIPEGIVWNRISQKFKQRYVNESLRIVRYRSDGLTANSLKIRCKSPVGVSLYYSEAYELRTNLGSKIKNGVNYWRFALHAGPVSINCVDAPKTIFKKLYCMVGWIVYVYDKLRLKGRK